MIDNTFCDAVFQRNYVSFFCPLRYGSAIIHSTNIYLFGAYHMPGTDSRQKIYQKTKKNLHPYAANIPVSKDKQ